MFKESQHQKLIRLLQSDSSNDAERCCLDHLKRYIKFLQSTLLETFLQFVTGSDILLCDSIIVSFSNLLSDPVQSGKGRRPIVRTCGPVLELLSTYQSYNELSEEFTELLNNKDASEYNIVWNIYCKLTIRLNICNALCSSVGIYKFSRSIKYSKYSVYASSLSSSSCSSKWFNSSS